MTACGLRGPLGARTPLRLTELPSPKVIREKQLCKKMLAWLEARVECTSSSLRPVGSGSF